MIPALAAGSLTGIFGRDEIQIYNAAGIGPISGRCTTAPYPSILRASSISMIGMPERIG